MIALSTCWNSSRYRDGEAILSEIAELGFEAVELSHGLKLSLADGLVDALAKLPQLQVSSLHNFCPMPANVVADDPNIYEFSSSSPSEQEKALTATRRTCEFAQQIGVKRIVLHLGTVPMPEPEPELRALIFEGRFQTPEYHALLEQARRQRERVAPLALSNIQRCLPLLAEMAESFGVTFGLENQPRFSDFPMPHELHHIFSQFPEHQFQYWMDVGHAQIQDFYGFTPLSHWQEEFGHRLLGFHLHDVRFPCFDHQFPGMGKVAWDQLRLERYPEAAKVWELSPNVPRYLIERGREEMVELATNGVLDEA
ncbi:MAG: sugar phosphate isomerase/epimerase [Verrucomicrobiae bacterium]|nr:sugar phosphate isomerase/epimerase [Verrucomicrobiae bacterium]